MDIAMTVRRASRIAGGFLALRAAPRKYRATLARITKMPGPTLVIGSAPLAARPTGVDDSWFRVSANASQTTLSRFGLPPPHLTIFRVQMISSTPDDATRHAWAALKGHSTGHLIVGAGITDTAVAITAQHGYRAGAITAFSSSMRTAVIADMIGEYLAIGTNHKGVSNGIFAVLLALKLGARPVVMSGFSMSSGWAYAPDAASNRYHQDGDLRVCRLMHQRGYPVFTADPAFAEASGLPLWTGQAEQLGPVKA